MNMANKSIIDGNAVDITNKVIMDKVFDPKSSARRSGGLIGDVHDSIAASMDTSLEEEICKLQQENMKLIDENKRLTAECNRLTKFIEASICLNES